MKAIKYLLFGLVGLVVLALVGVGAALVIVDGQFVKTRLERAMKEKNRTLKIEGTPQLKLFPVAGIALGKTTLSEPGSDKLFLSLDSVEVAVRTMPLLSHEVAVETLKLSGLNATVVKRKDGSMNFSDLSGPPEKDKKAEAPPNVRIAEVLVEKSQLSYRDEATGQELLLAELSLKTGRLDGQTPGDVAFSARVTGKRPEVDLRAQAAGAMRFNLGREEFGFDKFAAQVKGRIDQDSLAAEFSAPKVEVSPANASGTDVKASIVLKGPQRNVNAKLLISSVQGSATALTIQKVLIDLDAAAGGAAIKANLEASIKANLAKQDLSADVSGKLDDSALKAKLTLSNFAPLKASFDLAIDRVNLDRYMPPDRKEAKSDDRVDLGALKGKTVNGKLALGALTVKHAKLENIKAEVKLADGKLELSPQTANLYGGTLSGSVTADANGNRISIKEAAQSVAVGALLRDVAQKDVLEGRGNVNVDVQTSGGTVTALKKALAGSARVEMKDGAIKGINLADSVRNAKSMLGSKQQKGDATQKTDFSEASASFKIAGGVARNDDLKVASPFVRIGGAGNLDIGNNTIDYLAKATLAATAKGQGGRDAKDVAGITLPIKLTGPLDNPAWNVDYSALISSGAVGGITESLKKGAGGVGGGAGGGIGSGVRGLFKR